MLLPSVEGQEGGNWIVIDSGIHYFFLYGNNLWFILYTLYKEIKEQVMVTVIRYFNNPCSWWESKSLLQLGAAMDFKRVN